MPNRHAADAATFDPHAVDLDAFARDLDALRRETEARLGPEDVAHLRKIERIGRAATAIGLLTAWLGPNPVSVAGLSLGRSTRWLLMHHVGHRGYDKVPRVPRRFTSKVFARGRRRMLDWPDWMIPEAWIYEHNVLHHGHTGEERDPDLIERNTEELRAWRVPKAFKYAAMAALAATWRASYYAPNTLVALRQLRSRSRGSEGGRPSYVRELVQRCYLPYAVLELGLPPLLFLPLGPLAATSALVNTVLAEVLTNVHTFLVVGPNHTGSDLYRFDDKPGSRGETLLRQVLGSANYRTGGDFVDYAHLWLNYQIEHHLFPDMPMLRYRELKPKVQALCEKHGVPYVEEGVLTRAKKMLDVAVGKARMRRASSTVRAARARRAAREPELAAPGAARDVEHADAVQLG